MSEEETIVYKFSNWLKNESIKPLPNFYFFENYTALATSLLIIIPFLWIFIAINTSISTIFNSNIQNFGTTIINLIMSNLLLIITYIISKSILISTLIPFL